MKTIEVSNATFGLIWSRALESDQSEEDILTRILNSSAQSEMRSAPSFLSPPEVYGSAPEAPGFTDARYSVNFPEGTRIFRTYKGKRHEAQVIAGLWFLDGGDAAFNTLNMLNKAIGATTENVWVSWSIERSGKIMKISDLRDPTLITTRTKSIGD